MNTIMPVLRLYILATLALSRAVMLVAAEGESPKAQAQVQKVTPAKSSPGDDSPEENSGRNRAAGNILGQADTSNGEARREAISREAFVALPKHPGLSEPKNLRPPR